MSPFFIFYQNKKKQFQIFDHAAELAYRFIMAFVPFLMLLYQFVNTFSRYIPGIYLESLKMSMPGLFDDMISIAQNNFVLTPEFILANFLLILFLVRIYVAAVRTFMKIINNMRNMEETRSFAKLWLGALKLSFLMLLLIVLLFFSTQIVETFINFLFTRLNMQPLVKIFSMILRYSGVFIGFFVLNFLYRRAPSSSYTYQQAIPGSLFVVILWSISPPLLTQIGKTLERITTNTTYILISLFSFLLYVYLACVVLLMGCIINEYVIDRRSKIERIE
ncbi:MAG: YihY/virulence factor BrkB family protein [Eubacteriaceae bacterium]|jgi:membrane protein|nr:YihY/virulence factor BrkB family protein [Eubacteriaceae bacterium]